MSLNMKPPVVNDREYLKIGLTKDSTLIAMWNGARHKGNESEDDLSLFNKLAYRTNRNEDLMYTAFMNSPYFAQKDEFHEKKCTRKDYMTNTIKKAVAETTTTAEIEDESFKLYKDTQNISQNIGAVKDVFPKYEARRYCSVPSPKSLQPLQSSKQQNQNIKKRPV